MSDLKSRVKTARAAQQRDGEPVQGEVEPAEQRRVAVPTWKVTTELLQQRVDLLNRARPDGGPRGEQLVADVMTALGRVQKLDLADPRTVLGAVLTCAQLGLRIGGALGQAYILPFRNYETGEYEAQFVLGYKGIVLLAAQSSYVRGIAARTVFARDRFRLVYHEDRDELFHEPYLDDDQGEPLRYYCRTLLDGGGYELTRPVSRERMRAHRKKYVKTQSGPWFDDRGVQGDGFEAMAHKTMIKIAARNMPLSASARRGIAADGGVRRSESIEAEFDQVTEHAEREGDPSADQSGGAAEAAYEWPDGATAERPAS